MTNISVQADKKFTQGFILTESDIRRLIQLASEQVQKTGVGTPKHMYVIKFENGTIAETPDIEEIFVEDNLGSNKIIMVEIFIAGEINQENYLDYPHKNSSFIRIIFNDIEAANNNEQTPISYRINGNERDWVMVTSSLIEERILKTKRRRFSMGSRYLIMLSFLASMVIFMFILMSKTERNLPFRTKLSEIEKAVNSGSIKNSNELILQIEKARIEQNTISSITWYFFFPATLLLIYIVSEFKLFNRLKLYPLCNFRWGDYEKKFDAIERRRKFILGFILVTIIVGIAINLTSTMIWNRFGSK